jgi:hypothetical protein
MAARFWRSLQKIYLFDSNNCDTFHQDETFQHEIHHHENHREKIIIIQREEAAETE